MEIYQYAVNSHYRMLSSDNQVQCPENICKSIDNGEQTSQDWTS